MVSRKVLRKSLRTLSVFLIFYLLFIQLPLKGIVLCVGEDGHIALEEATPDNQCGDIFGDVNTKRRPIHKIDPADPEGNHCGDCKDLLITDGYEDQILTSFDLNSDSPDYRILLLLPAGDKKPAGVRYDNRNYPDLKHFTPVTLSTKLLC